MARKPALLVVNLRRAPQEARLSLLAARRLGYDVVLMADQRTAFGELVAGFELVDTYDLEQALAAARSLATRFPICGVVTWADRDVELVAHIGEALGLRAPTPAAARRARNKFEMKQALAHIDGLVPRHARVTTSDELEQALPRIGFPAVLKPTGASGSKGIFVLHGPDDAEQAFEKLQEIARPEYDSIFRHFGSELILEEFVPGPEVSVEGWVCDGRVTVVGITDKWTTEPWHLELQHIHPSALPGSAQSEIRAQTKVVLETLGLDFCPFHLEGKVTPDGFRLGEVAARIGGDYIDSHLVPLSQGVDFYGQVLRLAAGETPSAEPTQTVVAAGTRFLTADEEGVFAGLRGAEQVLALPHVEHLFLETPPGGAIQLPPRQFLAARVAGVVARHPSYETVAETLARAAEACEVLVGEAVAMQIAVNDAPAGDIPCHRR